MNRELKDSLKGIIAGFVVAGTLLFVAYLIFSTTSDSVPWNTPGFWTPDEMQWLAECAQHKSLSRCQADAYDLRNLTKQD